MFQIKNSKAASVMMAAFFVSGCQPKEDKFFEVSGGDPIFFQHFFWFIGHPEIFLPLSLLIAVSIILLLRRLSKRFAAFTNQPFSLKFTVPRLWLYGWGIFILLNVSVIYIWPLLVSGSSFGAQSYLHDTYYVVAHFHYILSFSLVFLLFSGLYWGLGRYLKYAYNQKLAVIQFGVFVIGVSLILLPEFNLLTGGMPRRRCGIYPCCDRSPCEKAPNRG